MMLIHVHLFVPLNLFTYILAFSSGCRRPDGIPCCYNEYLDVENKTCRECIPGRIGWGCKEPCKEGYYGHLCRLACTCRSLYCDPVFGCLATTSNGGITLLAPNEYNLERMKHSNAPHSTTKRGMRLSTIDKSTLGSSTTEMSLEKRTKDHKHGKYNPKI
ncbi:cell death abnormality protein 1-like [Saccostrea cucullata]|uniref:cell death abnormality protein 1-like n=1 Tax=Saccostrea cuccullata TaxID=36930 RepID=UPI002ED0688B